MPENPHWYTLRREWRNDGLFCKVVEFMRQYGYTEYFRGWPYTMLNVNDHKYWTMGAPVDETILINRKPHRESSLYDDIAEQYDDLFTDPESIAETKEVIGMIDGGIYGSVLDIGCGTGLFLDHAKPDLYTGIDPSLKMLNVLAKKHPAFAADTIHTRLEDFVGVQYDLVISLFGSLNYVKDYAVKRIPQLLTPGGRFFVMFYKPDYMPVSYSRSGIYMDHIVHDPAILGNGSKIIDYHNFYVVTGNGH